MCVEWTEKCTGTGKVVNTYTQTKVYSGEAIDTIGVRRGCCK